MWYTDTNNAQSILFLILLLCCEESFMADTYQILVVDDDFSIVNIIETALKQAGYQVLTAYNGEAACQIVNTRHPHLIIMDVMMPQCNGIIATMKIRQNNNVPILMLSAKAEGSDRVLGLKPERTIIW